MKSADLMRISPFSILVTVFVSLFVFGFSSASAQVGTPPFPSGPPPGSASAPPCDTDLDLPPDQAKDRVPCLGFTLFVDGTSADDRANTVRGAGAVLRFNYNLVNATAVLVPDEATLSTLLADPNIVALIPDRPVHAIAKPKNPGGGKGKKDGGGSGEVVPSGVERIGAAPGALTVTGSGVGVAIVDTGLDFAHTDLTVALDCFDAFGGNCQDDNGHGTRPRASTALGPGSPCRSRPRCSSGSL